VKIIRRPATTTLLGLLTSLLLFLAAPGAVAWWPLAWIGLTPLLLALHRLTPARAARLGLVAGLFYYTALLYWIVIVLGRYGHLSWLVTLPALLLLAFYMSLYLALFAALTSWAMARSRALLWLAPSLWVVLDFVRGRLFSGFPWQDLGYTQAPAPYLIQVADLFGHHGVTFLLVLVNCLVFLLITRQSRNSATPGQRPSLAAWLAACLLVAGAMAYNVLRYQQVTEATAAAPTIRVAVVQGNIEQDQKWTQGMQRKTVEIYNDLSRQALAAPGARPELLVWPETALPFAPAASPIFPELVEPFLSTERIWLLTGAPVFEQMPAEPTAGAGPADVRYYNATLLLTPTGQINGRYDKEHLVPFGEYMPLRRYLPLPRALVESVGDFTAGQVSEPLSCQKARIGVLICFESIFPEIAGKWAANGANLLVNQTNDAWFGRSSAPWQHLSMVVFRAVETRRSLARAANTGVSGFIDPLGRLPQISPLFTPCYLTADLPLLEEKTFFVRHRNFFVGLCALGSFFLLTLAGRQPTKASKQRISNIEQETAE